MNSKILIIVFLLPFISFAQSYSITVTAVSQRTDGSGNVDIYFNLSGPGSNYNISLEVSFNAGSTYTAVPASFLSGHVNGISPGNNKHIVWNGLGSFPNTFSNQAKLKLIANPSGGGGNGQPCPGIPTFTDSRDGQTYNTVLIGSQCWMKENLKYLPSVVGSATGSNEYQCHYVYNYQGTDVNAAKATANYQNYGVLYNWPAALTACPIGWHLPSETDWTQLVDYVVSQGYPNSDVTYGAGNALKSCRQVNSPLGGNCNTSEHPRWESHATHHSFDALGFSALPGGIRSTLGDFSHFGSSGIWWSSRNLSYYTSAWSRHMGYGSVTRWTSSFAYGFSVRCLRDTSSSQGSINTLGCNAATNSGTLTQGTPASEVSSNVPYTGGNGGSYSGQTVASTGVTGLTATLEAGSFVNGNGTLTYIISGTPTSGGTASFALNIGGQSCILNRTVAASGVGTGQPCPDIPTFTDPRDSQTYTTVQIGSQCWMKENLKYLPAVVGSATGSETLPYHYVNGYNGSDVNVAKATPNYQNYGALYNWPAALTACPQGWHLPSDTEWTQLTNFVVSQGYQNDFLDPNGAGNALKSCRQLNSPFGGDCNTSAHPRWDLDAIHHGFNAFGFSALPSGSRDADGSFGGLGDSGSWWSSTELWSPSAWFRFMYYFSGEVQRSGTYEARGFSVRCLRD